LPHFRAALLLIGCGEKSDKPSASTNAASGGSVLTAPVDYLGSITKGQQNAVKTVDTTSHEPGDPVVQRGQRAQPEKT